MKVWEKSSENEVYNCIQTLNTNTVNLPENSSSNEPQTQIASKILTIAVELSSIMNDKSRIKGDLYSGFLCAGTDDCKIKIWRFSFKRKNIEKTGDWNWEYKATFTDHSWEVWQLRITDNQLLFSGSFDHTIKVWDLESFKCIKTLTGHKGYIHSLVTGKKYHLLSGSGDKTIKIWRGFGFT